MDKEYNDKYLKLIKDNMKSKYDVSVILADLFNKMKLKVETVSMSNKEVWGLYMHKEKNFKHNYKILSEIIEDVDKFLELLDNGDYCCGEDEYNLMEFIEGANNIDFNGDENKLGYRYFESYSKNLFFIYNEREVRDAIGEW